MDKEKGKKKTKEKTQPSSTRKAGRGGPSGVRPSVTPQKLEEVFTLHSEDDADLHKFIGGLAEFLTVYIYADPNILGANDRSALDLRAHDPSDVRDLMERTIKMYISEIGNREPLSFGCPIPLYNVIRGIVNRKIRVCGTTYIFHHVLNDADFSKSDDLEFARTILGEKGYFAQHFGWRHYARTEYLAGDKYKKVSYQLSYKEKGVVKECVKDVDLDEGGYVKLDNSGSVSCDGNFGGSDLNKRLNLFLNACLPRFKVTVYAGNGVGSSFPNLASSVQHVPVNKQMTQDPRWGAYVLCEAMIHGNGSAIIGYTGLNLYSKNPLLGLAGVLSLIKTLQNLPDVAQPSCLNDLPTPAAFAHVVVGTQIVQEPALLLAQYSDYLGGPDGPGKFNRYCKSINYTASLKPGQTLVPTFVSESIHLNRTNRIRDTESGNTCGSLLQMTTFHSSLSEIESAGIGKGPEHFAHTEAAALYSWWAHTQSAIINIGGFDVETQKVMQAAIRQSALQTERCVGAMYNSLSTSKAESLDATSLGLTQKLAVLSAEVLSPEYNTDSYQSQGHSDFFRVDGGHRLTRQVRELLSNTIPSGPRTTNTDPTTADDGVIGVNSLGSFFGGVFLNPGLGPTETYNGTVVDDPDTSLPPPHGSAADVVENFLQRVAKMEPSDCFRNIQNHSVDMGTIHVFLYSKVRDNRVLDIPRVLMPPFIATTEDPFGRASPQGFASEPRVCSGTDMRSNVAVCGYRRVGEVTHGFVNSVCNSATVNSSGQPNSYNEAVRELIKASGGWGSMLFNAVKKGAKVALNNRELIGSAAQQAGGLLGGKVGRGLSTVGQMLG